MGFFIPIHPLQKPVSCNPKQLHDFMAGQVHTQKSCESHQDTGINRDDGAAIVIQKKIT
jgi:hypothetical protein